MSNMSQDEPLEKFVVLVPIRFNDGSDVAQSIIVQFQNKLFDLGGGFTIAGTVEGTYRMADGSRQVDKSVSYWIGIPPSMVDELRTIVSELGAVLGQEAMYLEHSGSRIELVPPHSTGIGP